MTGVGGFGPGRPIKATILFAKKWTKGENWPYIIETEKPKYMTFALERDLRSEGGIRRVNPNKKPNPFARKTLKTNTANVVS